MVSTILPRVALRSATARRLCPTLAIMALALPCVACGQSTAVLLAFRTEQQAQEHCPDDTVVWLDLQSFTYRVKAQGSYSRSDSGRYACRGEADRAGMHLIPN